MLNKLFSWLTAFAGVRTNSWCGCSLRVIAAFCFLSSQMLLADFPQARLATIYPPGGKQNSQVTVAIVGTDLDDLQKLTFSHPGITAIHKMSEPTEFDPQPKPILGQMVVSIAADVLPGIYDVRAVGRYGVSNPRAFMIGTVEELRKEKPADDVATAIDIPPDAVVSGKATAGKADHYAVLLAANQRVRVSVWSKRLESRMTPIVSIADGSGKVLAASNRTPSDDPVLDFVAPIAGKYIVKISDFFAGGGDELFYRLSLSTGPQIDFVFPPVAKPGETTKISVFGRGLPGSSPAILEGGAGSLEQVTVDASLGDPAKGTLSRVSRRLMAPRDSSIDAGDISASLLSSALQPISALAAVGPVVIETSPNDTSSQPQAIQIPCDVAGRFHPKGDRDWYSFTAKAGEEFRFEVISQRLGLPTDASLTIESVGVDDKGQPVVKEIAFSDDIAADFAGVGVDRPTTDPAISFKAPVDGNYRVLIRDLTSDSRTLPEHAYILEIRRPAPDFRLLVMLALRDKADANKAAIWTPSLPIGGSLALDVLVLRRDGFAGEISLEVEGLPAGVTASTVSIESKSNRGSLVLSAPEGVAPTSTTIRVIGRSKLDTTELVRFARSATLTWNVDTANSPQIVREMHDIPLAVVADIAPVTLAQSAAKVWETSRGGKLSIPLGVVRRAGSKGELSLTAANLPAELKVAELKLAEGAAAGTVELDFDPKLPAGSYVVILTGAAKASYQRNPQAAEVAKADHERIAALSKERTAIAETAKQAVATADKLLLDSQVIGKQAVTAIEESKKSMLDIDNAAKQTAIAFEAAKKLAAEKPGDAAVVEAAKVAEKAVSDAALKLVAATTLVQERTVAQAAAQKKTDELIAAKVTVDKSMQESVAKAKATEEERVRREKIATDTAAASVAKDIDVPIMMPPITIRVAESPLTIAPAPEKITLKQGTAADLTLACTRLFGFVGEIALEAAPAAPVNGLAIAPLTIPADQPQGILKLTTTPQTPPGSYELVIKAKVKFFEREIVSERRVPVVIEAVAAEVPKT